MREAHEVNEELCRSCKNRAADGAFEIYHCDYVLINGKCRLDPPGTCSHYIKDENYDPSKAEEKKEQGREVRRLYKLTHHKKSSRPVGRPKKEW